MSASSSAQTEAPASQAQWVEVCSKSDLVPNSGICALINQQQVALLYSRRLDEVFAIGNYDPIGKANVMSRGIIGSLGDAIVVASPLYKQHYDLRTGECLENPEKKVSVFPVRVTGDKVEVQV